MNLFELVFDVYDAILNFSQWVSGFLNHRIDVLGVEVTPFGLMGGAGLTVIIIALVVKLVVPLI